MVAALAAKLEKIPTTRRAGSCSAAATRCSAASTTPRAFDKAGPAMESEPELMLRSRRTVRRNQPGQDRGKGLNLRQVLKDQPDNPQALVLAGTDASLPAELRRRRAPLGTRPRPGRPRFPGRPEPQRRHRQGAQPDGGGKPAPTPPSPKRNRLPGRRRRPGQRPSISPRPSRQGGGRHRLYLRPAPPKAGACRWPPSAPAQGRPADGFQPSTTAWAQPRARNLLVRRPSCASRPAYPKPATPSRAKPGDLDRRNRPGQGPAPGLKLSIDRSAVPRPPAR